MWKLHVSLLFLCCLANTGQGRNVFQMTVEETEIKSETFVYRGEPTPNNEVQFSFAKHFQNNMVLQRAPARANIYGFSPDIGQKVIAQMNGPSKQYYYSTTIEEGSTKGKGVWRITLDPLEANVTVNIHVMSERGSISLNNVIFGDVWLCGGQSNMQFAVSQMFGAEEEIADSHNYPNIRLMTVSLRAWSFPLDDLLQIEEAWTSPSNNTVGHGAWTYFSAVCWLYGKAIHKSLGVPVGMVASNWGGTPVEAWSSPDSLKKCGVISETDGSDDVSSKNLYTPENLPTADTEDLGLGGPQNNSVLYNAMIHPLLGMTIHGAIWYQGEADDKGTMMNNYNCTFPAMIADWREKFSQTSQQTSSLFPFGFVQLAAFRPAPVVTEGFPDIRWHQTADIGFVPNPKMPYVFMAVAMDLPDFNSSFGAIHPRDKMDVGARLALSGLAVAYNQSDMYQGPFPQMGGFTSSGYTLSYGPYWLLDIRGDDGFEFYCQPNNGSEGKWVPTDIISYNSTSVILYPDVCDGTEAAAGLRYAWRETPCAFKKCAIYSSLNELPAPPFVFLAESGQREVKFVGPIKDGYLKF